MAHRREGRQAHRGSRLAAGVAAVMALVSGAWVVALGWSVAFLLSESVLLAIYGVLVLLSPALFTVVAILAWRGAPRPAIWLTVLMLVKWPLAYLGTFITGGGEALAASVPVGHAMAFINTGFFAQGDVLPGILSIIHYDVEPFVVIGLLVLLIRASRR
jgi:hypothetical protein